MTNDNLLTCDVCGKSGARLRHVTRTYGEGANLLIIENIPMISCPHCGESYFTAATLHEIERIKQNRKQLAEVRPVEVAQFS
jgi:YgiT-type zinc finger domain-containing protein